jgi:hypothetical protein
MQEEGSCIIHGFTELTEGSYENEKQNTQDIRFNIPGRGGISVIGPLNDEFISKSTQHTPSQQILTSINLQFA